MELHSMGKDIADAVLSKDIERLLRYDRSDLVEEDRKFLSNPKSDLYCYLFDASCRYNGLPSVYDVLRGAKQLVIEVDNLGKSDDGVEHAILLFFDGTTIDRSRLRSPDYLCEKAWKEIVSWMFRRVNGTWQADHSPFDAETDVLCQPD